jgi:hypothetical protein
MDGTCYTWERDTHATVSNATSPRTVAILTFINNRDMIILIMLKLNGCDSSFDVPHTF